MIRVLVRRRSGRITGFTVEGHSGLGPRGADIVCAGVSAITQSAAIGLASYALVREVDEGKGLLDVTLRQLQPNSTRRHKAAAILRAMLLGLRQIEQQYPERVRIEDPNQMKGEIEHEK